MSEQVYPNLAAMGHDPCFETYLYATVVGKADQYTVDPPCIEIPCSFLPPSSNTVGFPFFLCTCLLSCLSDLDGEVNSFDLTVHRKREQMA